MTTETLAAAAAIARKDITIEFRTRSALFAALLFSMLAATIFHFAWDPAVERSGLAPGAIWAIFVFSGLLCLQRSFSTELVERAIDGLMAAPTERRAVFWGKMAASCTFTLAIQAVAVPTVLILYNVETLRWLPAFCGVLILATIGLTSVGTLFSSMSVNTRLSEVLLPMLSLPFFIPVVALSARTTELLISGGSSAQAWAAVKALVAFDLVFVAASAWAFPYTIEE
jgi:heme exporter protein B